MLGQVERGGLTAWWRALAREATPAREQSADEEREAYTRVVLDVLRRCDDFHAQWLEQAEPPRRHERIANAAAVYRWRLRLQRERLLDMAVPDARRGWHRVLLASLDAACTAAGRISSGYRFNNVRRICEGDLLLAEARTQTTALREFLGSQS